MSFGACFLVAYRGTDDYEIKYKSEQNQGGEYRATRGVGVNLPIGVSRIMEIPVWDQAQGLGQRMPNIHGQQTQSPFVFLNRFLSVEVLVLIRLFFSTTIALSLVNLIFTSWGGAKLALRLFFLDFSLLGPMVLYTVLNDFWVEADQYWGLAILIVGLLHKKLFTESQSSVRKYPVESLLSLLFGAGFMFIGHPSWYPILFFSALFFVLRERYRWLNKSQRLFKSAILIPFLFLPALTIFDLFKSSQGSNSSYVANGSIWDVFSCDRLRCVVFPPIAAIAQPVLRIGNEATSRTEFFNASVMFILLPVLWRLRRETTALIRLLKHCLAICVLLIMALLFSRTLANSDIQFVSSLFSFHVWRLAHPLLILSTFCFAVYLGSGVRSLRKSTKRSRLEAPLVLLSVTMALLSPVVMFLKDVDNSTASIFRDRQIREYGDQAKSDDLLRFGQRFVFFNEGESRDNYRDPYVDELFGLSFDLQLARAGFPTLQNYGAARVSNTLTTQTQNLRSSNWMNSADCKPEVLEFLAVSSIFVNTEDASGCREKLLAYFGEGSVREINKVAGPPGTASLFRPKSFATWSIVMDSAENPNISCPLLEQDCLMGLEVTKLPATGQAPFRLCEDDCLFTYKWAKTGTTKQVLLPVNFDKTIEINDSLTGERLKTANYQGLLAVQVDGDESGGVFVGDIRPDLMMWLRVAMTYLHTIVFLGALGAMLFKGVRAVRLISQEPESLSIS